MIELAVATGIAVAAGLHLLEAQSTEALRMGGKQAIWAPLATSLVEATVFRITRFPGSMRDI